MASSETSDWLLELLGLNKVPCKRHVHHKKPGRRYPLHWRARFLNDDGLREHDQCFGPIRDVAIARMHAIQVEWDTERCSHKRSHNSCSCYQGRRSGASQYGADSSCV
jgi:hypothetical protein